MLSMLKRHSVQLLRRAGHAQAEIARLAGVSERAIRRIQDEPPVEGIDDDAARQARSIGRPPKAEAFRALVGKLLEAEPELRSVEILRRARLDGYLAYGPDAANVLFHVVSERHLRCRSMVFTTNKPLSAWGRVLHNHDLAAAILDRVLDRGQLRELDGPSLRTRHLGLDDPTTAGVSTEPARISGNDRPEFPEPTLPDGSANAPDVVEFIRHPIRRFRGRVAALGVGATPTKGRSWGHSSGRCSLVAGPHAPGPCPDELHRRLHRHVIRLRQSRKPNETEPPDAGF